MEEQMKIDWDFIKETLFKIEEYKKYYTDEQIEKFERQMKRVVREKKLKRIFNI